MESVAHQCDCRALFVTLEFMTLTDLRVPLVHSATIFTSSASFSGQSEPLILFNSVQLICIRNFRRHHTLVLIRYYWTDEWLKRWLACNTLSFHFHLCGADISQWTRWKQPENWPSQIVVFCTSVWLRYISFVIDYYVAPLPLPTTVKFAISNGRYRDVYGTPDEFTKSFCGQHTHARE